MRDKDMFLFFDGGRQGLVTRAMNLLTAGAEKQGNKPIASARKVITIGYDLDSLVLNKRKTRGMPNQCETLVVAGPGVAKNATRKRRFHGASSSTNIGTLVAPVIVKPYSEGLAFTYQEKKDIFGNFRLCVGGRGELKGLDDAEGDSGDDDEDDVPPAITEFDETNAVKKAAKRKTRDDDVKEPFMYHCMKPTTFYQEFLHA